MPIINSNQVIVCIGVKEYLTRSWVKKRFVDAGAARPPLCVVARAGSRGRGARYDRIALDAPAGAAITGRGNGGVAAVAAA